MTKGGDGEKTTETPLEENDTTPQLHLVSPHDEDSGEAPAAEEDSPSFAAATGETTLEEPPSEGDDPIAAADSNLPVELRYLLALMLLRRRALRPLDQQPAPETEWTVEVVADGSRLHIAIPACSTNKLNRFSESLAELLYCEAED